MSGKGMNVRKEIVEQLSVEIKPKRTRRVVRRLPGKSLTMDDPLWQVVGLGHSGQGDISANKHRYLAEAYSTKLL